MQYKTGARIHARFNICTVVTQHTFDYIAAVDLPIMVEFRWKIKVNHEPDYSVHAGIQKVLSEGVQL